MKTVTRLGRQGLSVAILTMLLAGCVTRIHPKDETISPAKVPLGSFSSIIALPMIVERSANDAGDQGTVEQVRIALANCLLSVFKKVDAASPAQSTYPAGTLVIEPAIEDMKKVDSGARVLVGSLSGSSAILLRTRYRDGASGDVLSSPVFYARGDAMEGAQSFGASDTAMLNRVVRQACDYARANYY